MASPREGVPCTSVSSGSGLRPGPESNLNGNPGRVSAFPVPEVLAPAWPAAGPAGFCSWNPVLETLESPSENGTERRGCVAVQQSVTTSTGSLLTSADLPLPDLLGDPLHSSQAGTRASLLAFL